MKAVALAGMLAACLFAGAAVASAEGVASSVPGVPLVPSAARQLAELPAPTRTGRDIYEAFRAGLSDRSCQSGGDERWRRHFAHVPDDLAARPERLLPLFAYVLDALQQSHLPSEYALIPFVESGYRPGARSPSGPTGLWQFIAITARNHRIDIGPSYDGRLSPVDSTRAAVRYLRTLHGMFAGDWRLAVMGYNAGEYRIFGALRNAGQRAMDAELEKLSVPGITRAYVDKLQALSCLLQEAGEDEQWLAALDRPIPVLAPAPLAGAKGSLDAWADERGVDPALVRRLNPALAAGQLSRRSTQRQVLAPLAATWNTPDSETATAATQSPLAGFVADATDLVAAEGPAGRTHLVQSGDSIWRIASRYEVTREQLFKLNDLSADSVLRPGMRLRIDPP